MTLRDFSETGNKVYAKASYTAYHGNRSSVFDNSVLILDKNSNENDGIMEFELILGSKSRPREYVNKGKIDLNKMNMRAFPVEDNVTPRNLKNREELLRKSSIYLEKKELDESK